MLQESMRFFALAATTFLLIEDSDAASQARYTGLVENA
jgi:hypothetical protein